MGVAPDFRNAGGFEAGKDSAILVDSHEGGSGKIDL